GLVIYGLSSIHDAKINNNIGLLKTQQYYLILSNREMDNFMKLVSVKSEHIKVVDKEKCRFKTGEEVLVIDGAFKGVRGKVARVSSEQRVVIELTSHWLIATAYIPTAFIKKTD
ncbi:transcription termination/antitermination protein NusG, partial [Leyella stercorea]|uniref:transcription termination/antitermination protein NusG n=1 Tax=Leyella stercorea TaxID=363265 RepID=UPI00242EE939